MTTIALMGAGGKMGTRLSTNLQGSKFQVRHVEVSEAGRARLKDGLGMDCPAAEAQPDHFGGAYAKQHIVSALMQGPESAFELGERIARRIYAPVMRAHRVTVEQMALLEPGLSETVAATLLAGMREALDDVVRRGVPHQAARDFLLGHMNIEIAVLFDEIDGVFSDAANKASENAKPKIFHSDWLRILESDEIAESIRRMT